MEDKEGKLSLTKTLLMGGALFSMHFGGSSMIWPVTWGQQSGRHVFEAFGGIYLTAVFFPLLGYIAMARGKGTLFQISSRVSVTFAYMFCGLTILILGPLFVIPRMSAAAWDAFLQISGYKPQSFLPLAAFSSFYYVLVYWFISKKSKIVDRLSKILFPLLILCIAAIFVKGFSNPLSSWVDKAYLQPAFAYGFVQGYATMELPCALFFAVIIINDLKTKGVSDKNLNKYLFRIGFIGMSILTVTHFCHMLIGSMTGNLFTGLTYSALYANVVMALWGRAGGAVFNIALFFAALTCAIGLTAATSEYFEEVGKNRISYSRTAKAVLVISAFVSTAGLTTIIKYTSPALDIIYPPFITLTLCYALLPGLIESRKMIYALRSGVITASVWGVYDGVLGFMSVFDIEPGALMTVHDAFPLAGYGLGWVSVTAAALVIGYSLSFLKREGDKMEFYSRND